MDNKQVLSNKQEQSPNFRSAHAINYTRRAPSRICHARPMPPCKPGNAKGFYGHWRRKRSYRGPEGRGNFTPGPPELAAAPPMLPRTTRVAATGKTKSPCLWGSRETERGRGPQMLAQGTTPVRAAAQTTEMRTMVDGGAQQTRPGEEMGKMRRGRMTSRP